MISFAGMLHAQQLLRVLIQDLVHQIGAQIQILQEIQFLLRGAHRAVAAEQTATLRRFWA